MGYAGYAPGHKTVMRTPLQGEATAARRAPRLGVWSPKI